jgi:transposase InsO family protein
MERLDYVNHPQRAEIERRVKIINFFDKHGAEPTREAFEVARSTVYRWKKLLKDSGGKLVALAPLSRAPRRKRARVVSGETVRFIERCRNEHPGMGKATIKPLLDDYCHKKGMHSVSESTIGRVISDLKKQGRLPVKRRFSLLARSGRLVERAARRRRNKLRRGDFRPRRAGDLVQMDAIYVFDGGIKRYILSAIDLTTRFAFALCYRNLSSLSAKDLLLKFLALAPFKVRHIQTDNGSEFADHFYQAARELGITHFFNYARHPQGNGHVERFQGILRQQYLQWCEEDPANVASFNQELVRWLLWYNTQRPHLSLGRLPPLRFFLESFAKDAAQSQMLWTLTHSFILPACSV